MSRLDSIARSRALARPVGLVITLLGAAQGASLAIAELFHLAGRPRAMVDQHSVVWMLVSMAITMSCGGLLTLYGRNQQTESLRRRDATLVVAATWFAVGLFGALPFILDAGLGATDAFFEAISGFTTTGATIITDIEGTLSAPLLVWRSVMQWLGGMGIIVLFVAVFPHVGVGGRHLFRNEAPGPPSESLQPRIAQTSYVLWRLYAGFTAALIAILWFLGMDGFDALCHAMTTMSTGGFSTRNDSIGAFDHAGIELAIGVFMLLAGINFSLYYGALATGSWRPFARSTEFRVYGAAVVLVTVLLTIILASEAHTPTAEAARRSFFMVATTLTSTGFGTHDYMAYPGAGLCLVLAMMVVGGCAGSTAGGIKVIRLTLLAASARGAIRQTLRPRLQQPVRIDGRAAPDELFRESAAFIVLFFSSLALGTFIVSWVDALPAEAAFGAMLSCLSNMGPGPFHVTDADHFAAYSDAAKLIFSFAMILGRLEFFTLLALLMPEFWRR